MFAVSARQETHSPQKMGFLAYLDREHTGKDV
jgi:hypothetical protein